MMNNTRHILHIPESQVVLPYPGTQIHAYAFISSSHVPPFSHGSDAHSFSSEIQKTKAGLKYRQ